MAEIETLQPDGGDLCYMYLFNAWDGEDDQFNIKSIEGVEKLVNLKSFEPISMISEKGLDDSPLLLCNKLETVSSEFIKEGRKNDAVLKQLEDRGVEIV